MARLLGSAVLAGVILIHTPPMDEKKRTETPVVAHGGLELQDELLGLFLDDRGGRGSGRSGRVRRHQGRWNRGW